MLKQRALATTILSATAVAMTAGAAHAQIDEITVTATKRTATAQSIPVTVQAVDEEALDELNIGNFTDYVRQLPNVTFAGRGPGQNTVYIRGMAVQPIGVQLSGAQGSPPNVALYLDEQPVTAPGRNLDVYATDLERIEVLPGPQGTLYGASSQAGTIRLITNKPQFDEFGAGFDASMSFTKDGEMSNGIEAYVNIPVVEDKLAFRAAFYDINQGGYIDNVPGTFTTDPSVNPLSTATPDAVYYETAVNTDLAEEDFNDSFYQGARLSLAWNINPDWDLLVQHTRQKLGADGVFDYDPDVGDLDVTRFFPDELDDKFNQTSWTLNGRLGMLDLVYTGAYLDREVNQSIDYTGYNNSGAFVSYYTCTYSNPDYVVNYGIDPRFITPGGRECLDPVKGAKVFQEHSRNTHEFRFNTPEENRWRVTAGVFYDDFEIETQDDFLYLATPDLGFVRNGPIEAANNINDQTRAPGVAFFNDITRTEEQLAFFGEFSFDLIPNTLTASVGARRYNFDLDYTGSSNFATGIFQGDPANGVTDLDLGRDYDVSGGHTPEPRELNGEIYRLNLAWTPTQDLLFYGTYSEGFRPGGFNRGGGLASVNPTFPTVDTFYTTDDVVNYELGWKTRFLDNTVQFNGSAYFIEWSDMQVSRFDPQNVSILTFIENAADSEIFGVEGDITWMPTANLTLNGAFSYNDTELTNVKAQIAELAPVGSQLPLVPEFQGTLRARYEWMMGDYDLFAQGAVQYAGDSFSSLLADVREKQDSYATGDLSAGSGKDNWQAQIFVENVWDERAELFINTQDDIRRITTNRPRTVGLRVSYDY